MRIVVMPLLYFYYTFIGSVYVPYRLCVNSSVCIDMTAFKQFLIKAATKNGFTVCVLKC